VGQLLYYFDSGHFVDYLYSFRSPSYEDNVHLFRGERTPPPVDEQLLRKQWEHGKDGGPPRRPPSRRLDDGDARGSPRPISR